MATEAVANEAIPYNESLKSREHRLLHTHQEYAGDPTSVVTPNYVGELCHDTSNAAFYIATTLLAAGWKKITP